MSTSTDRKFNIMHIEYALTNKLKLVGCNDFKEMRGSESKVGSITYLIDRIQTEKTNK